MISRRSTKPDTVEDLKIGLRIRELRIQRRFTLQDFPTKTRLPRSTLEEIEGGEVVPPVSSLSFESEINHSFRALEDTPATVVVAVWSRTEQERQHP